MEVVAGLALAVGIVAVVARFVVNASSGDRSGSPGTTVRLPRVIDESIGMWLLRSLSGRSGDETAVGDAPSAPAEAPRKGPRRFDATMAARLGIRRAGDVAPPRRSPAGAWREPGRAAGRAERRPRRRWIAILVMIAVVVGGAIGGGLAMLDGRPATSGSTGPQASATQPPTSAVPSS